MPQRDERVTDHPSPLPEGREDSPRTSPLLMAVFVVVGVLAPLLWGGVAWQLVIEVPIATRMFRDFNLKLPILTEATLAGGWVIALGVFVACVLACALAAPFRRARGLFAGLLLFAGVLAPAVLNLALYYALHLPMWKVTEGLSR